MTDKMNETTGTMKPLNELLRGVDIVTAAGDLDVMVSGVTNDSRRVRKNSCFVAIKGFKEDGLDYAAAAVQQGAACIVSQCKPPETAPGVTWVQVKNDRLTFSKVAAGFYGNIADSFYAVGVTGTNGKTTVISLLGAMMDREVKTARIGTLGMQAGPVSGTAGLTTPESVDIFDFLHRAHQEGYEHLVMEVSSVALDLYRVEDIAFSQAVFTNFSGDHLDFHKTMEGYLESKMQLFKNLGVDDWAVINIDDPKAYTIIEHLNSKYLTYGFSVDADIRPLEYDCSIDGVRARLQTPRGELTVRCPLLGRINLLNIMAAVTSAIIKGIDFDHIIGALAAFRPVKGRLDIAYNNDFAVLVDYAHTDDALKSLLQSLQEIVKGRLIVVFGAGGGRDKSKRPRMGEAAAQNADFVVVTSDNPRKEEPDDIIKDVLEGFPKGFKDYITEADRETAIQKALDMACKNDLVVVAGKGHEDYQIFKDKTIHFDDYEVVQKIMEKKKKHA